MSPQSCQMLLALALGFAFAGLCCSAYRLATDRLPSLSLLACGPRLSALAALALLIVAAPFLIMRTILLGGGDALDRFQDLAVEVGLPLLQRGFDQAFQMEGSVGRRGFRLGPLVANPTKIFA